MKINFQTFNTFTKMKTLDFLNDHKRALRQLKSNATKTMLSRMVADNIADLLPAGWQATFTGYGLRFKPEEGVEITPDVFDKLMGKLAKALNNEPSKSVNTELIYADFWVYPSIYAKREWMDSVNIEFVIGNTEKCDFVEKRTWRKELQPTGYCLALKEKKYLQTAKS